jgi:opacity protein-like surface antigen
MGLKFWLGVGDRVGIEAAAVGPLRTRDAVGCADVQIPCTGQTAQPDFTFLTAILQSRWDVGRAQPFVGAGVGRLAVQDFDPVIAWILSAGANLHVAGPFSAGLEYRASTDRLSDPDRSLNHELGLQLSIDLFGG